MANAFEFGKGLHWPEANAAALPFASSEWQKANTPHSPQANAFR